MRSNRLTILGIAIVVGVGLYIVQQQTRIGALIRAGVDDRETAGAMGVDIDRLFAGMFVAGAALAGLWRRCFHLTWLLGSGHATFARLDHVYGLAAPPPGGRVVALG